MDNLDDFLARAGRHHVRAIIALASWHGTGIKWWHEGGQYFGRKPWKEDAGQDSIATLCDFWRQLGDHLQGHPAVFAYTMCVEWTMPCGNLTGPWQPASEEVGLVPGDTALWYWRRWVMSKYGSLSDVNDVYGASFAKVEDIPVVDYAYDKATKTYASPDSMILDYQNYREWTTLRYFRPQIAALRAADDTHLVTISNHMRSWNLWEGAARHFLGYTPAEQYPYVDFFTYHANYDINDFANDRPEMEAPYEVAVQALACAQGEAGHHRGVHLCHGSEEHTARNAGRHTPHQRGRRQRLGELVPPVPRRRRARDAVHESAWLRRDLNPPHGVRRAGRSSMNCAGRISTARPP
ncbi:MAG: beta-galactosidase [Pirellulaceae bacterium]